jgi:lipopolysaccharide transport system permease protein
VNPLLQLLTYGLVFVVILPGRRDPQMEPYLLFFFCGILPWTWFNASLLEAASVLIAGGSLIKKVMFPAEVLPVVTVITNLAHFVLGLPILVAALIFYGRMAPSALLLPLPILVQLVFTVGLALIVSALTVHFRDLQNILGHLVHLWFFASPILYYYGARTGRARTLLRVNPMSHLLVSYQQMLFEGHFDHWKGLFATAVVALLAFWLGAFLFDRLRDTLAEEV